MANHSLQSRIQQLTAQIRENQELINSTPELAELAQNEIVRLQQEKEALEQASNPIQSKEPHPARESQTLDLKDVMMEIRAAAGGNEAGLFAADLYRMYARFAEKQGWRVKQLTLSEGGLGNIKEVGFEIIGSETKPVYPCLKFESGVHRVQRVPITEASGRVHTSAASVVVLPKVSAQAIQIKPEDLQVETFRSRGPGGQSVNTTDSAVRITHLPTGVKVSVQNEKSQHKNRAKALQILSVKLSAMMQAQHKEKVDELRRDQVGMGERSEKIRTYNFPQNRLTDHRIKKSWHNLNEIMEGNLSEIIEFMKESGA